MYPFVKTDSGLSAYCHGNVDFPNVWERCWPTRAIPIYKGAICDSTCTFCTFKTQSKAACVHVCIHVYVHTFARHLPSWKRQHWSSQRWTLQDQPTDVALHPYLPRVRGGNVNMYGADALVLYMYM